VFEEAGEVEDARVEGDMGPTEDEANIGSLLYETSLTSCCVPVVAPDVDDTTVLEEALLLLLLKFSPLLLAMSSALS
jgi:hypothetical protein